MEQPEWELIFNGTPYEFVVMAEELTKASRYKANSTYFAFFKPSNLDYNALTNLHLATIHCGHSVPEVRRYSTLPFLHQSLFAAYEGREPQYEYRTVNAFQKWGEITAQKIRNGSILRAVAEPKHVSEFQAECSKLCNEGRRLGYIEQTAQWQLKSELQLEGKPPDAPHKEAWLSIPDVGWDRQALKMWWNGNTSPEIARQVHVTSRRVTNRLSELRHEYGQEVVLTDKQRRAMGIIKS